MVASEIRLLPKLGNDQITNVHINALNVKRTQCCYEDILIRAQALDVLFFFFFTANKE